MATAGQTPPTNGAPPPAAPPPAPVRAADALRPGSEDARFIAFAKENIGLLASVASVPLLSSAAGALKPPQQMDHLTVLSSLLCVVVFAACFTLRGVLGAAPKSRRAWVKAMPGAASLVVVGLAIVLIAAFSSAEKFKENEKLKEGVSSAGGAGTGASATAGGARASGATGPSATAAAGASTIPGAASIAGGTSGAAGGTAGGGTSGAASRAGGGALGLNGGAAGGGTSGAASRSANRAAGGGTSSAAGGGAAGGTSGATEGGALGAAAGGTSGAAAGAAGGGASGAAGGGALGGAAGGTSGAAGGGASGAAGGSATANRASGQPTTGGSSANSPTESASGATSGGAGVTRAPKDEAPMDEKENVPHPYNLQSQIILYLSIYPMFILALGLILVTNFTQQTARDIQTLIEQSLPEQAESLFKRLQLIARFYEIGRQPGKKEFLKIGEDLIEDRNEILRKLSEGMIELGGAEAVRLQQVLVQTFKNSFDAVSCCDLKFWANVGADEMSRDYFRLNLEALKRSDKVTRLLIFEDNELARIDDVIRALEHHHRFGIAWAVVPYMDLDPSTREEREDVALDFALYDDSEVAIYFRDYRGGTRKLRAVFPGSERHDFIDRQRVRYAELLAQCWLLSSAFLDRLNKLPPTDVAKLKYAAVRNSLVTARQLNLQEQAQKFGKLLKFQVADLMAADAPALQDCYLFPNCEGNIPAAVKLMYELRSRCRDWSGPPPPPPAPPAAPVE